MCTIIDIISSKTAHTSSSLPRCRLPPACVSRREEGVWSLSMMAIRKSSISSVAAHGIRHDSYRCDFIHDGEAVNRPNNAMEIYLQELAACSCVR